MEQAVLYQLHTDKTTLVEAYGESRQGGRAENQDNAWGIDTKFGFLVTVCDGMGGGPGGRTASTIAVKTILDSVCDASEDEDPANVVVRAVCSANMAIYQMGEQQPRLKGMGSTCTVILFTPQSAIVAHVGDSRVYQLRGHRKVFRTFDHSYVFGLVQKKLITEEQARLSAQSNIITQALGIKPDVDVECTERPYRKGDLFILCSDGIHGTMPEPQLIKMLTGKYISIASMIDDACTTVDNLGMNQGGGHDNLTIVAACTQTNSKLKEKMNRQAKITILVLGILLFCSIGLNIYQAFFADKTGKTTTDNDVKTEITEDKKEDKETADKSDNKDKSDSEAEQNKDEVK